MDNTGLYLKYDELILELNQSESTKVTVIRTDAILSNKTADVGGAIFEYNIDGAKPIKTGDVINQLGRSAIVIAVLTGPDKLRVEDLTDGTTDLENGSVEILRSDKIPRFTGERIILDAMNFIDEKTGQFFNKRPALVALEGNNSPTMWFPVPIIDISKLLINSTEQELFPGQDRDFIQFIGRAEPQDDRRNPRIKLNVGRGRDSIFIGSVTSRIFSKDTLTEITGDFGFLEPDGSTPPGIVKATKMLASKEINSPSTSASATSGQGPIKRRKVDLHEEEFFEIRSSTSRGSLSGIAEVDQIMATFRTPIRLGGSIRFLTGASTRDSNRTVVTI